MIRSKFVLATAVVAAMSVAPAFGLDKAGMGAKLDAALGILKADGAAGVAKLKDPSAGLLDLAGTGLHTWGFDAGTKAIEFDHSGQTEPGMDMSGFALSTGKIALDEIVAAVKSGDGHLEWVNEIPHPTSGALGTSVLACGEYAAGKIVCAMAWPN